MSLQNISELFLSHLNSAPADRIAYVDHKQKSYTYAQLLKLTQQYQISIQTIDLKNNADVICLVPRGADLLCCLIACFSAGKTVVFIDPKMGFRNFFNITKNLNSTTVLHRKMGFLIQILKLFFKNLDFKHLHLQPLNSASSKIPISKLNSRMIDGFTSGTTGQIKRIRRQHSHMLKTTEIFNRGIVHIKNDNHMIGYTLSALRNIIDEGTAFEFTENNLFEFIEKNQIHRISGPPYVSYQSALAYSERNQKNTAIENIVMGGAPVQKWLLLRLQETFPSAIIQNIYGCTECEPISVTTAKEILAYKGLGYYVGHPVAELNCKYEPISNDLFELILDGPHVTSETQHHTGDLVRKNKDGSLTLTGRKSFLLKNKTQVAYGQYEIETLLENNFETIKKAAVIQKEQLLKIHLEFFKQQDRKTKIAIEIFAKNKLTELGFDQIEFIYPKVLPYDKRHQWKVQYHLL